MNTPAENKRTSKLGRLLKINKLNTTKAKTYISIFLTKIDQWARHFDKYKRNITTKYNKKTETYTRLIKKWTSKLGRLLNLN